MAIQKVIIKRDADKRSGNQGNPRGTLLFRGEIDKVEMWATTDWEFMEKPKLLKQEELGLKQRFRKQFVDKSDQLVIEYNDELIEQTDKLKWNFINKMIKLPDMRSIDSEPAHNIFWTYEFVGELSIKKAKHIRDISTVINQVNLMNYVERKNICFFYAPHLEPHKLKNSQLYTKLVDIDTDRNTGQPKGILINSPKRIESILRDYYGNTKDSKFRTDVNKAIQYGIIDHTAGKGYYVEKQFIGIDNESVYAYLKTDLKMYENYVLPQLSAKDITKDDDDDFVNVEKAKKQAIDFTDYTTYELPQLIALAVDMGISRARNMQKPRLLQEIAAVVEENKKKNAFANKAVEEFVA